MNPRVLDIQAGMSGLKLWLFDAIHMGLAALSGKPESFWLEAAARLTDAKARGIANRILTIPAYFEQPDWQGLVLEELGELYLLVEAFEKLEALPESLQADLHALAGINIRKEDLLAQTGLRDQWQVMGRYIEKEVQPRIDLQRIWLMGKKSGRIAYLLDYSFNGAPFPYRYNPGSSFEGEVIFHPGSYPLRVALRLPVALGQTGFRPVGWENMEKVLDEYAGALGKNPFLHTFPVFLEEVYFFYHDGVFFARDKKDIPIPFSPAFQKEWELISFSGGNPVTLFGEWNGKYLNPLSAIHNQRLISLSL